MSRTVITGKKVAVYLLAGGYQKVKDVIYGEVKMQTESDFILETELGVGTLVAEQKQTNPREKIQVLIPWTAVQHIELP
jgi:hypothetical protein